jgi:IS1 family transposase
VTVLRTQQRCRRSARSARPNLKSERVQIDELWSFVAAKQKNVTPAIAARGCAGDAWTFVAIDADSKLVISWTIGERDTQSARAFLDDVAGRLANRVQVTTDGHKMYLNAVPDAFSGDVHYSMLVKIYGKSEGDEKRYSPATCLGAEKKPVCGTPDRSTSAPAISSGKT